MTERIGFVGLGIMGQPMARNLMRAGYPLTVYHRRPHVLEALIHAGARPAGSPLEVAAQSDIVITIVSTDADVESVVTGPKGILLGSHEGMLLIDMSTIAPKTIQMIAEKAKRYGVHVLDAPVSGGDIGAEEGTLSIMVGGDRKDFERALPIFQVLGKTITHCGPIGAGQTVKACNQVVLALILEGLAEGLVFGSKMGIDPNIIIKVLSGGLAQNRILDLRGSKMIHHNFDPGARIRLHLKDLGIVMNAAREHGVALPGTAMVQQFFTSVVENGGGDLDHTSLLTILETLSHHTLSSSSD